MIRDWDKIIINKYDRIAQIIDWFETNREYLDDQEFSVPLNKGVIEFQEEALALSFKVLDDCSISFRTYAMDSNGYLLIAKYRLLNGEVSDIELATSSEKALFLQQLLSYDKTLEKLSYKFIILMTYICYYKKEEILITDRVHRMSNKGKKSSKKNKRTKLVSKVYKLKNLDEIIPPPVRRTYKKPDHSVSARGHYRHYKNGKVIWIKPYTRYQDKEYQRKEYEL